MRTLIMVLMIVGLMSTVGVYAASITGTTGTVGGTGSITISAPASSVDVDWTYSGNNVTGGTVNWTSLNVATHTVKVTVGASSGSGTEVVSVPGAETTAFTLDTAVAAKDVATAEVLIFAN